MSVMWPVNFEIFSACAPLLGEAVMLQFDSGVIIASNNNRSSLMFIDTVTMHDDCIKQRTSYS